jgi:excisionase family DNA binding protein
MIMAGMFYSIQEVATKLGKGEDQIKEMVKEGKLREFRDGAKILFKVNEVDAIAGPASMPFAEESAISLTPLDDTSSLMPAGPGGSTSAIPIDLGDEAFDLSKADTSLTGEGLNVLGEMDSEFKISEDSMGKTHASGAAEMSIEKIEEDVNLDSFGSGSGLLDLSLQADDTSLGGVLDEIYPGAEAVGGGISSATPTVPMDMAAEAEQMLTETAAVSAEQVATMRVGYVEPEPDTMSNMMGLMLIVPFLAAIYASIVAVAATRNTVPVLLTAVQDIVWYVMIGAAVVSLLIMAMGFVFGVKPKAAKMA